MCQYCERTGANQSSFCDENWNHPSDELRDEVLSNLHIGKSDWEARVYNHQSSTPELIVTSKNIARVIWDGGIACIYIPIHYCPVCGRKLGKGN